MNKRSHDIAKAGITAAEAEIISAALETFSAALKQADRVAPSTEVRHAAEHALDLSAEFDEAASVAAWISED